jgi:hypothetical protein
MLEAERRAKRLSERPYDVTFTPVCETARVRRKGSGRLRLGEEPPKDIGQWHLSCTVAFNASERRRWPRNATSG